MGSFTFSTVEADFTKKIPWMLTRTLTFTLEALPSSVGVTFLMRNLPEGKWGVQQIIKIYILGRLLVNTTYQ